MAQETIVGFSDRFRSLVLSDDVTRWRLMAWTIAIVGTLGSFEMAVMNRPVDDALPLMIVFAFLILFGGAVWHCSLKVTYTTELESPRRRSWLYYATATCATMFAGVLIPWNESRKLHAKLTSAAQSNNFSSVVQTLDEARQASVHIDHRTIKTVVEKSLRVSPTHPPAWAAVMASLNYTSSANAMVATIDLRDDQASKIVTQYTGTQVEGRPMPEFQAFGVAPESEAARFNDIGGVVNKPGNRLLVGRGGWLTLDNTQMKHVVLQNTDLVYRGGPLVLEDVYFLNCTFHFDQGPHAEGLVLAIVDSPPSVSFVAA